jgi:lysine biosynthesis protein LysW
MPYATCPGCNDDIYLSKRPRLGEVIYCPSCAAELEVISLTPLELDWHLEEDEADDEYRYDEDAEEEDEEEGDLYSPEDDEEE